MRLLSRRVGHRFCRAAGGQIAAKELRLEPFAAFLAAALRRSADEYERDGHIAELRAASAEKLDYSAKRVLARAVTSRAIAFGKADSAERAFQPLIWPARRPLQRRSQLVALVSRREPMATGRRRKRSPRFVEIAAEAGSVRPPSTVS